MLFFVHLLQEEARIADMAFEHLVSIYAVGFLGALSSATVFMLYSHFSGTTTSLQNFSFACIAGAFHWLPAVIAAYAVIVRETTMSPVSSALLLAFAYLSYGIILSLLTSITKKALATRSGAKNPAAHNHRCAPQICKDAIWNRSLLHVFEASRSKYWQALLYPSHQSSGKS
jgi:ABC-type transport system involved in multi-copper enzyme maturation permease subunit